MKILLAEDDFASRKFMSKILDKYGEADITVNGLEAVDAFLMALDDDERYDLVILDVMMPMLDGYQVLSTIRKFESDRNFKPEGLLYYSEEYLVLYLLPFLLTYLCPP